MRYALLYDNLRSLILSSLMTQKQIIDRHYLKIYLKQIILNVLNALSCHK